MIQVLEHASVVAIRAQEKCWSGVSSVDSLWAVVWSKSVSHLRVFLGALNIHMSQIVGIES